MRHHDLGARIDEGRHLDLHAVLQHRALVGRRGGAAAHHRIGLGHHQRDVLGQCDADGRPSYICTSVFMPSCRILRLLADEFRCQLDLVVSVHVHEHQHVAARIEELEVLLLKMDFLHRLVGAEALVQLGAAE